MARTRLTRRRETEITPFVPSPLFAAASFPSFARAAEELTTRADEMMRAAFAGFPELSATMRFPALNVSEAKDDFTVTAELPGMAANDVTIDYSDGVLTMRGEKQEEQTKEGDDRAYYVWERQFGSFQRSLPFPGGIAEDKIAAEFKDGVLTVHLPKADEAKTKRRPITITTK